eukprot:jgi/Mesen1/7091/ME000369S06414
MVQVDDCYWEEEDGFVFVPAVREDEKVREEDLSVSKESSYMKHNGFLSNLVDTANGAMGKFDFPSNDSQAARYATAVAIGVGVTAVAGVAVAAAVGGFVLLQQGKSIKAPWERKVQRPKPLSPDQWRLAFEPEEGRLRGGGERVLGRVRRGGVDPNIRGEVWPFLLGLYDPNSTAAERQVQHAARREEYEELRQQAGVMAEKARVEERRIAAAFARADSERARARAAAEQLRREIEEREAQAHHAQEDRLPAEGEEHAPLLGDGRRAGSAGASSATESSVTVASGQESDSASSGRLAVAFPARAEDGAGSQPGSGGERQSLASGSATAAAAGGGVGGSAGDVDVGAAEQLRSDPDSNAAGTSASGVTEVDGDSEPLGDDASSARPNSTSEQPDPDAKEEEDKRAEDFATWQRIMRLDAVRMNAAWIPYSAQADDVSPREAASLAASIGLIDDAHLEPPRRHHAARLVAILEAYAVHDPEIGYCQGMSDLLSPFVALIADDSEAFWCYERFMRKVRQNFRTDEVGIRRQLDAISAILRDAEPQIFRHLRSIQAEDCLFVYRMVVVLLRRELSFEQTLCLWEVVWADEAAANAMEATAASAVAAGGAVVRRRHDPFGAPTKNLLLYFVAAIVKQRKRAVLECKGMDEILRLCNSFAMKLDVWSLLEDARQLVDAVGGAH